MYKYLKTYRHFSDGKLGHPSNLGQFQTWRNKPSKYLDGQSLINIIKKNKRTHLKGEKLC